MKRARRGLAWIDAAGSGPPGVPASAQHEVSTLRTEALGGFRELVVVLGGDPAVLLRGAGIEPDLLDSRSGVVAYGAMVKLLERASLKLNCPDFGMRLAALQRRAKVLGPLHVAMRNSPTLGDALRYCADQLQVYGSATQICFERLDDRRRFMHFEIQLDGLPDERQAVEHALSLIQHAALTITGGRAHAREVWFAHAPGAPLSTYGAHFNAAIRFGQCMNGLSFEEHDLNRPVPDTDPELYEIATNCIDDVFPPAAASMRARVRRIADRLLTEGNCTHERVAAALGLHPRTIQRRLRNEGESFESIKDRVRRDAALCYLQQSNVPLVRLTEILGYSETSVLSRSCHRWFAASPRRLRTKLNRLVRPGRMDVRSRPREPA